MVVLHVAEPHSTPSLHMLLWHLSYCVFRLNQAGGDLFTCFTVAASWCFVISPALNMSDLVRQLAYYCPQQSPTQTELDTSERSLSKRKPQADSRINWRPHIGGAGIVFVASHPIASSPPIFEDVTSVFA